ncbi:MAG: sigma-70 family RNA polymerase sigma factor [Gammaproteobacteria bacterium]|nr:sigma-70 family RNA polymerase sigma factor [Gammaproteobacteria bacterium]
MKQTPLSSWPKCSNEFVSALFEQYGPRLVPLLGRRLESQEIGGCYAETYLQLLETSQSRRDRNPHAYLFKTASNLAVDHLRRRRVHTDRISPGVEAEALASTGPEPDAAVDASRQIANFREILAGLRPCRTVFLLNRIDGLSHAEISQRVGISKKSVERYIVKALERFHRRLNRQPE